MKKINRQLKRNAEEGNRKTKWQIKTECETSREITRETHT